MMNDFLGFIRFEVCLFASSLALFGALLFGNASIWVVLSAFFLTAFMYSLNMITDKKEDLVNHGSLNYFVRSRNVLLYSFGFLLVGFLLSFPANNLLVYVILSVVGSAYSFFRLKETLGLKNVYTAFVGPLLFFLGAGLSVSAFSYYLLLVFVFFVLSVLGDLRDVVGDAQVGIRTIPVVYGTLVSQLLCYFSLVVFGLSALVGGFVGLLPLLPFVSVSSVFVHRCEVRRAHKFLLRSVFLLPLFLWIPMVI